jgi:AcrR family transcriptional regulator
VGGLRERKKQRTRELISQAARRLFLERGFEGTTVAAVAREAEVSEQTVFNYFPAKEDLFYSGLEAFEEALLDAVRSRAPGESALAAFGRFVGTPRGILGQEGGDPEAATEQLQAIARLITGSPALLRREREIFARYTAALAALLAAETGSVADSLEPWAAAHAMLGLHRASIDDVRRRALAGATAAEIARELPERVAAAVALLERGLGKYAVRR